MYSLKEKGTAFCGDLSVTVTIFHTFIIYFLLLSGCSLTPRKDAFERNLEMSVGQHRDEVVKIYGTPTYEHVLPNHKFLLEYNSDKNAIFNEDEAANKEVKCVLRFYLNSTRMVYKTFYAGSECYGGL